MKRILTLFLLLPFCVFADHYFGGYINYTHLNGFTYQVSIVTYTDHTINNSDRDSVLVKWGDGEEEWFLRTNGNGNNIYPGVRKNIYEATHTYINEGNYQVIFQDIYRMFDVNNMTSGKSGISVLYFDAIIISSIYSLKVISDSKNSSSIVGFNVSFFNISLHLLL